jgi:hypothetical protein
MSECRMTSAEYSRIPIPEFGRIGGLDASPAYGGIGKIG